MLRAVVCAATRSEVNNNFLLLSRKLRQQFVGRLILSVLTEEEKEEVKERHTFFLKKKNRQYIYLLGLSGCLSYGSLFEYDFIATVVVIGHAVVDTVHNYYVLSRYR